MALVSCWSVIYPGAAMAQPPESLPPVVVTPDRPVASRPRSGSFSQKPRSGPAPTSRQSLQGSTPGEPPVSPPSSASATSASSQTVSGQEVNARIFSRPAEALEIVPGLIVTQHSGDGKANQYFLRGFNLDHGTDFAIFVDDMPVNMRTHAHGQGYADLNFLIPELIGSVDIKKGPYFADEGDFSSVGAAHINLLDSLRGSVASSMASVTVGSFGYHRALGITSQPVGEGNLLIAGEANTYDGPWA
ncbi:MAG TPA: TonB-dependent receptor plug domain-containing protein, partial [Afipia sp.]